MTQDNTHRVTVSEIDDFKKNRVWQEICRALLEASSSLQEKINTVGGDQMKGFTSRDMDIIRLQELHKLCKLPDEMMELAKGNRDTLPDDFDPYATGPLDQ